MQRCYTEGALCGQQRNYLSGCSVVTLNNDSTEGNSEPEDPNPTPPPGPTASRPVLTGGMEPGNMFTRCDATTQRKVEISSSEGCPWSFSTRPSVPRNSFKLVNLHFISLSAPDFLPPGKTSVSPCPTPLETRHETS